MSDGAKIVVDRASKLFLEGTVVAFRNVELSVRPDEILCIVGPSGCGKTTLLRCIGGLVAPTSGRVLIDGAAVDRPRPGVAIVFQHFGLLPWKTVAANVAFGLKVAGAPRGEISERADHYIKLVGLAGFESHYPYQLSGGMQQRVGLARALATHPEVLLMDEPFASVDAQTREVLQEELLELHERERKTMIFITHSFDRRGARPRRPRCGHGDASRTRQRGFDGRIFPAARSRRGARRDPLCRDEKSYMERAPPRGGGVRR